MGRPTIKTGILISACLLGDPVRYDAQGKLLHDPRLKRWHSEGRLFKICPEIAGGLPTPRPPAELSGGDGVALLAGRSRVLTQEGEQLNEAFIRGAEAALTLARANGLELALLKANSPSCGNIHIHNGEFSGTLVAGMGVTAALLASNGIRVFNETQLDELTSRLEQLDNNHT